MSSVVSLASVSYKFSVLCIFLIRIKLLAICLLTANVEEDMDRDRADPEFLRILELQTGHLERRVRAHQARLMLVTCFDSGVWLADCVGASFFQSNASFHFVCQETTNSSAVDLN